MLFLDANIILEILFKRDKSKFCLEICSKHDSLCLSPTSLHIIYYYAEKVRLDLALVQYMLEDFIIVPFTVDEFKLALQIFNGEDMEDALQIATAINNNVQNVFTLDSSMINKYKNMINFV